MGNCGSSNDKNVGTTNMTGPGLPPQQIIPQPVEVTNIDHTLAEKISAPPVDNLQTATSQNIINNSINNQISPQMNQVNSIPNTINEINTSLDNNNLPVNNTFNQGQSMNINNNNFIGSSQNGLNNTINNNSQMISQQPMTNYSLKGNDFNLGSRYSNGKERRRMYIVVQLPGREIEITKLYFSEKMIVFIELLIDFIMIIKEKKI